MPQGDAVAGSAGSVSAEARAGQSAHPTAYRPPGADELGPDAHQVPGDVDRDCPAAVTRQQLHDPHAARHARRSAEGGRWLRPFVDALSLMP